MIKRNNTKKIMVGNVQIGGQDKVVIQSMCNTKTKDIITNKKVDNSSKKDKTIQLSKNKAKSPKNLKNLVISDKYAFISGLF